MTEALKLSGNQAVFTVEQGTISGDLEIGVGQGGEGQVRYADTEDWYRIGNEENNKPRTWKSLEELDLAIGEVANSQDSAGNLIPFQA